MARYIDSAQQSLFVRGSLEELLSADATICSIVFALEKLDFSCFDTSYRNDETGRPAIHPRRLLAVWMLGLLRGIDSSVALAYLCKTDLEFRWALQDVGVEKSTLCLFRKHYQSELEDISLEILSALGSSGFLPADKLGLDGTVLRAAASCQQSKTRQQLMKKRKQLKKDIQNHLEHFDTQKREPLQKLKQHQEKVEKALDKMDALKLDQEKDRLTLTEPEARYMRTKEGSFAPGYNAQVVSDLKSSVIVHAKMIEKGGDSGQLNSQLEQSRKILNQVSKGPAPTDSSQDKPTDVAADAAYHDTRQLVGLLQEGITPCVPNTGKTHRTPPGVEPGFEASHFTYNKDKDTMTCPAGKTLFPRKLNPRETAMGYQAKKSDCAGCSWKQRCCPKTQHGRMVNRPLYEEEMDTVANHVKSQAGKQMAARRRTTVEGNMSRLKTLLRWRKCRCWGILGAQAELLLRQLTNNLMILTGMWKPLVVKTT